MVERSAPFGFPGYSDDAPLDLGSLGAAARQGVVDRLVGGTFDAWADAAARVGHCAHPIRLVGSSSRVDRATGEVLGSYSSAHEPFGVTYVRCGNRRASVCLSTAKLRSPVLARWKSPPSAGLITGSGGHLLGVGGLGACGMTGRW